MKYYLIIDIGTGNSRAALVDSSGEILGIRTVTNVYYRDAAYPDAQYFLPEEWWAELLHCCEELHAEHPDIRVSAVSSAGARQSIVLLDKDGRAFYGLPNIDNRGREYMAEIGMREEIYRRSGKWVTEDFCAAKLLGLRKGREDIFLQVHKLLSLSEWIAFVFTGQLVFEHSQACETQLYDLDTRQWSEFLCSAYGISQALLPPLAPSGSCAGSILSPLRDRLCMQDNAVFIVGGADTQVALKQTGMQPGDIAVVSGTTSPVVYMTSSHYCDPRQRVWIDAGLDGDYLVEMNPGVTGLNYQRLKHILARDMSFEELEERYRSKAAFSCTASFSSLLFYERRSLRNGGFFTRSPADIALDRLDMLWAVLADIACSVYEQLYRLIELTGSRADFIRCCGGGFRSHALCQMLADLSGMELRLYLGYEQATVQGLVRICSQALGQTAACAAPCPIAVIRPGDNPLIRDYHKVWLENRSRNN